MATVGSLTAVSTVSVTVPLLPHYYGFHVKCILFLSHFHPHREDIKQIVIHLFS